VHPTPDEIAETASGAYPKTKVYDPAICID
jgi:hypothetical protein